MQASGSLADQGGRYSAPPHKCDQGSVPRLRARAGAPVPGCTPVLTCWLEGVNDWPNQVGGLPATERRVTIRESSPIWVTKSGPTQTRVPRKRQAGPQ